MPKCVCYCTPTFPCEPNFRALNARYSLAAKFVTDKQLRDWEKVFDSLVFFEATECLCCLEERGNQLN